MSENIVDKSNARTYEQLTLKEKEQVEKKLSSLDYMNQISIIQFGLESSKQIAVISAQIISRLKEKEFEGVQLLINNLVDNLKTVNISKLLEEKKGGLTGNLIFRKKEEENIIELLIKQMLIEKGIDEIEEKLLYAQMSIAEDMYFSSIMIEKLFEYSKNQEICYITIQTALEKLETEKGLLEALDKQYPNNTEYSYRISEISRAIEKLKSKAHDFLLVRKYVLQFVSHINLLQRGNEIMVWRIEDAICNVISLWKKSFAIVLERYRLNNADVISKNLRDETNQLLEQNSQILKNTILRMTTQTEREAINVKRIQEVNKNLEQTFNDLEALNEEVEKIKKEAIKDINDIQSLAQQLQNQSNNQTIGG